MKKVWARVALLALLLTGAAQAEVAVPPLARRVTDLTATLDAQQTQALESRLAAFEAKKGAQLAVLIVPTVQPDTIEQFGIRVFGAWKLGRKGVDDGALLLVSKGDRKLRIEVGYGLEGALNDATAKRIVSEVISPYLKRGEYYAGIDAGVAAIIKVVEGEQLPPPKRTESVAGAHALKTSSSIELFPGSSILVLMFAVILGIFLSALLRRFLGRLPSALAVGGILGFGVWYIIANLILAIVAAVIVFILSLVVKLSKPTNSGDWSSGSDFSSSSSSDSGGSSSSSDFSGGGGDSGGGGASGDY